jgi:hypothetical protein
MQNINKPSVMAPGFNVIAFHWKSSKQNINLSSTREY